MQTPRNRYFINSLRRGLDFLSSLSSSQLGLTLSELAKLNNMSIATAIRYTFTLMDLGYAVQNPLTKRYSLTPKVLSFGFGLLKNMDLRSRLLPYMMQLTKEFDVTSQCGILDGAEVIYLERILSSEVVNLNLTAGSRLPAYCSALGKSIIAYYDAGEAQQVINSMVIKRHTPKTINDIGTFLRELESIKSKGYAINDEELTPGIKAFAVPIFKDNVVEGAFGVSFPVHSERHRNLETILLEKMLDIQGKVSM